MVVYEPLYIFFFFILVGLIYIPVFFYVIYNYKFNWIGLLFVLLSLFSYLFIGKYMMDAGSFADEHHSTLFGIGFLELTLLTYPYIFIGLSVLLGKKGLRNKS
ncbi:hypothetical protein [Psychrobacillus sp. OK032]|uniref:hypothetical protein n=1 Tax=Psychrobacillus sp. OK032 TaxID=1884358 RepID=UPI0008ACD82F|nr:hypothetical protein [Psychrobacillus sp. OK032]SES44970.1 hypothetical protein SAMN05518872_11627 [Psychrobacillus sp. OK032]